MIALLACAPYLPPEAPDLQRLALYDTAEPDEMVVLLLGQSNACGVAVQPADFPFTVPPGVRLIRNGVETSVYQPHLGPEFALVDELVAVGYPPDAITVVTRCISGSAITVSRDILVPELEQDIEDFGVSSPDALVYWQGEADARTLQTAQLYAAHLIGDDGSPSLRGEVEARWPGIRWAVVELRVRSPGYAPGGHTGSEAIAAQALVRSAQHLFGAWPGVCVVPSYDAPLMPGQNQPHVDVDGLEIVGRRAVHAVVDEYCP